MPDEIKDEKPNGDASAAGDEGKGAAKDVVSKGEYERVLGELEGLRNEVISPEYLEFLSSKDKPKETPPAGDKGGELVYGLTPSQIEAMSKADLAKHIAKSVKEEAAKEVSKVKEELNSGERAQVQKEIAVFGRTHADFPKWRPAMHGLSMQKEYADLTLEELYAKAKELYPSGPSKEEKEKASKLKGEKPSGDTNSYERHKKMSNDEIAAEALKETKEKLGIEAFPST